MKLKCLFRLGLLSRHSFDLTLTLALALISTLSFSQGFEGYYRFPNIHDETVIFTAEGDLWTVPLGGGLARRLTTHAETERDAAISPDGKTIAFSAAYEGPVEVYTMPIDGGLPKRWTYQEESALVETWTAQGKLVYNTYAYSTLPDKQLVMLDPGNGNRELVPLAQATEAAFDASGETVYFVRPQYHRNVTKRYKGGYARQIWKFTKGTEEAIKLTTSHPGEAHHPMWYDGRVYFITDIDGTMNIWSMNENGGDQQQHTDHKGWDVRDAGCSRGNIVYQLGADLWNLNVVTGESKKIDIRISSDMDQLREKWVEKPSQYISAVNPDWQGNRIVITARGRVFVAPVKDGRIVSFTERSGVRYRDAVFAPNGKDLFVLSDETGEFEFASMSSDGLGETKVITNNGKILRYAGLPSPDGRYIAYDDLDGDMWVLDIKTGASKKINTLNEGIYDFSWSPDSKWLAFVQTDLNSMSRIMIYHVGDGSLFPVTTDRANSFNPAWSPDGKFLYFLSDRNFQSLVGAPWGSRQPEPYFEAQEKVYHIALQKGNRSPFRPADELLSAEEPKKDDAKSGKGKEDNESTTVKIDRDGIIERIAEVPVKPGNYRSLKVNAGAIYLVSTGSGLSPASNLAVIKIGNENPELTTMLEGISWFKLSGDGKKILISKGGSFFMTDAGTGKLGDLSKSKIDLGGWKFSIIPQEEWRQMYRDAWRMERDYFYDPGMHGVNWEAMYEKYLPLVDRVTSREELSDLIGRYVGELSALHTSVRGGDMREDEHDIEIPTLGAKLSRDEASGGFRIDHIYKSDPDYPDNKSPLDDPYLNVKEGDIVLEVNGKKASEATEIGELLRNSKGKQVRLRLQSGGSQRDIIVVPGANEYDLRYRDWEYSRRMRTEELGAGDIGYVHLTAMGSKNVSQWYREFYPVFNRRGLIIDVRHNNGGNIDSFILEKLLRKAWMYWSNGEGEPYWNMQYAFRGHLVVLVDQKTASDGEAFADGFKSLGLGKTIGMRTWGGEIWLSSSNRLSDGGWARAPQWGVYGADGKWRIEGHGFVPDIEVDNLPHSTFNGKDAQLEAAIRHLQELIKEDPRDVPPVPDYPDKSFDNK